uniref:Uncharacterized protein n=1 Tax=Leersia perrieri TaxID=77586 RepID=A0A0D9X7Q9_9ORYZ
MADNKEDSGLAWTRYPFPASPTSSPSPPLSPVPAPTRPSTTTPRPDPSHVRVELNHCEQVSRLH